MFGVNPSMDGREIGHVASSEHQTSPVYFPPRLLKPGLWGCIWPSGLLAEKAQRPPPQTCTFPGDSPTTSCMPAAPHCRGWRRLPFGVWPRTTAATVLCFFRQTSQNSLAGSQVIRTIFFTVPPRHVTWAGRSFRELPRARALQGYLGRDGYAFVHCGVIISAEDVHR